MSPVPHPSSPALSCDALSGDVVRLEPLTPGHVPGLRRAAEGAGPSAFAAVPTPDEVEDYVARSLARRDAGAYAPFAQIEAATGRVVGHTAYLTPRWMNGGRLFAVEIGSTWLHPAARGTAVNPAAKLLLMTQAFESWGVDRVDIKTDARNEAARAAIAATGATFEAVLRAWQPSLAPGEEGLVRDTAMFSVTPPEWPRVRARLEERIERRRVSRRG
ncbi:GNAT family N-acetyltransferase [Actinomyces dentalis]|uniref:GNAT family N-acetyltransferase n=1 Tax=Actinomyces dentalis TaxID=272548 RepID=UPI0023579521|nr:GNAT family protein [Actinomyces dentalis]